MDNAEGSGVRRFFYRVWRIIRWPLAVLAVLYVVAILYELTQLPKKTAAAVAAIHAQKLTMADVDGKHLPPTPDSKLVDATVEGVDANKNGIRDDVELAIFKKYPNDIKLRAAILQLAKMQNIYLLEVFNRDIWKSVAEETGRAGLCLADATPDYKTGSQAADYVESITFNTAERNTVRDKAFEYITTHGSAPGVSCDVQL